MPTAARRTPAVKGLPFPVPAPIDKAIKTAAEKVEVVAAETKEAAARIEETVRSAATTVRQKGQKLAKDPKAFVDSVVRDGKSLGKSLRDRAETMKVDVSKEATRLADDVAERVAKLVDNSLHRLNVATRDDVRTLSRKVDALAAKIEGIRPAPA
ncbi:MAG: hypothetical protein DYH06_17470, partial [Acidobacteria bacterium ACB2]|nr:hypothetical protein [Acidobacteria bacterium ACB2]